VYNQTHLFVGASDKAQRRQWRGALDTISALSPVAVVAGHRPEDTDDSPRHIETTRRYLTDFDEAEAYASSAEELYEQMVGLYRSWVSRGTLWGSILALKTTNPPHSAS
jgi:hypothetical protein